MIGSNAIPWPTWKSPDTPAPDCRYDLILEAHEEIHAFTRTLSDDRLLVILNFTGNTPVFALPSEVQVSQKELLIGNYDVDPAEDIRLLTLKPYEARVYRLR